MTTAIASKLAARPMPKRTKSSTPRRNTGQKRPADLLEAAELRVTRPRLAIAGILFEHSYHHFTADEVLAAVQRTGLRLSQATVYNTLNDFATHGLVRRIATAGGVAQFDTNTGDHHHFHIEADNRVIDIPPDQIAFARLPEPPSGYRIANIDVLIRLEQLEPSIQENAIASNS